MPPRRQPVWPGPHVSASAWGVRKGALTVPGFSSDPPGDATLSQRPCHVDFIGGHVCAHFESVGRNGAKIIAVAPAASAAKIMPAAKAVSSAKILVRPRASRLQLEN